MKFHLPLTLIFAGMLLPGGCAGKATKTGCGQVTGLACQGTMQLQYADGSTALKRLDPDNARKDSRTVLENLFKPARYVETTQGSTLTFPCGKTLIYYDKECD